MSTSIAMPSDRLRQHSRGLALMVFSTLCFTTNVLLIRGLGDMQRANVWLISTIRFAVGIAVLAAFYWHKVKFARVFTRGKLAGRGVVGGLGVYLYYLAVVHIGAGRATFINNTYVIWGALLAVPVLMEQFTGALAIGSAAAIVGLAFLTHAFDGGVTANLYDGVALMGAFGSAYIVVTIRLLHAEGEHTTTIFAAQCVYGLLLCIVPAFAHAVPVSTSAWLLMTGAGLCASIGQLAMTRAFRDLPVAEGSLLQILVPVGIAIGGFVFYHETFAPMELIGGLLILAGTAFTALRKQPIVAGGEPVTPTSSGGPK